MKYHKKRLPVSSKVKTLPPDMDYLYFENKESYPFEPKASGFSLTNAWWLAESSFLVYCHRGFIRMALKLAGYDDFRFFEGQGTECFTAAKEDHIILSFRGTELESSSTLHELGTDLNFEMCPFEGGGEVHKGFLCALDEVWGGELGLYAHLETLKKEKERPLWITGHSLGGALATLSFARLPEATGLYVFGSPRVGDPDFASLFEGREVFRIEHGRDPIPYVPPQLPLLKLPYCDLGKLIFLGINGEMRDERPTATGKEEKGKILTTIGKQTERRHNLSKDLIKNIWNPEHHEKLLSDIHSHLNLFGFEWDKYFTELDEKVGISVEDHMPIYYVVKIWNLLVSFDGKMT